MSQLVAWLESENIIKCFPEEVDKHGNDGTYLVNDNIVMK